MNLRNDEWLVIAILIGITLYTGYVIYEAMQAAT